MGLDGEIMAVDIGEGDDFVYGEPRVLFDTEAVVPVLPFGFQFDVTPDGQRFLMIQDEDVDKTSSSNVVVVLGFGHDLASRRT